MNGDCFIFDANFDDGGFDQFGANSGKSEDVSDYTAFISCLLTYVGRLALKRMILDDGVSKRDQGIRSGDISDILPRR